MGRNDQGGNGIGSETTMVCGAKRLGLKIEGSGMKPKVRARAAELNPEPEVFQFKANITFLIKSKAHKYHILRNQHKKMRKIMT